MRQRVIIRIKRHGVNVSFYLTRKHCLKKEKDNGGKPFQDFVYFYQKLPSSSIPAASPTYIRQSINHYEIADSKNLRCVTQMMEISQLQLYHDIEKGSNLIGNDKYMSRKTVARTTISIILRAVGQFVMQ